MHQLKHLNQVLIQAKQQVEIGALYVHFRSLEDRYKVLSLALDEITEEPCVIYQALYGEQLIWIRTVQAWCDLVEHEDQMVVRFTKIV